MNTILEVPEQKSVLIVDQDIQNSFHLSRYIVKSGYRVLTAQDVHEGVEGLKDASVKVMFLDDATRLSQGRELLAKIHQMRPDVDVVLMVPKGRISSVVEAMKMGAQDCLVKPVEEPQLLQAVENCLRNQELEAQIFELKGQLDDGTGLDRIIGNSVELLGAISLARKVANFPVSVLIHGESGTGKELFASAIHRLSDRKKGPFVAIDCSAYPADLVESELFGYVRGAFTGAAQDKPGRLEFANGGTLFIDEIGSLSPANQIKLLRVLQERKLCRLGSNEVHLVDLRLICATNINLRLAISEGHFREDLYHRINEFLIMLPPLRERGEDIELLAHFFLHRFKLQFSKNVEGFSDEAFQKIKAYPWPGNIRQLESAIKHALILSNTRIEVSALPEELTNFVLLSNQLNTSGPNFELSFKMPEGILPLWDARALVSAWIEKRFIESALASFRYNRSRTAQALGIHIRTLGRKIREQGIG